MLDSSAPILVLDAETQNTFAEVGGKQNLRRLKISVVCVYHYTKNSYLSFLEHEIFQLEALLKTAKLIVGFNVRSFDFGVLQSYFLTPVEKFPVLDLMEEIEKVRGHRVGLQSVAEATFQDRKTGDGLDAVRLFREGRMKELTEYCMNDVRLTKDIYEYGKAHGKVFFRSFKDNKIYPIPVSWGQIQLQEKPVVSGFPTSLF